ncbi:MAG: 2OG-Fe(II) oxygenase [Prochloraceae cyanobacterium]
MHSLKQLGNEISVVEGLLDAELCQHVLQVTECCQFDRAKIEFEKEDTQIRSNESLYLDDRDSLLRSTNELILSKVTIVQKLLYQDYGIGFPHAETCSILRYQEGQFYKRHIDNILLRSRLDEADRGLPIRDVSVIGYLNEEFSGGETYFDRQDLKFKPKTGDVLVFPAFWTHPHQSLPITEGVKYSFVTWLYH